MKNRDKPRGPWWRRLAVAAGVVVVVAALVIIPASGLLRGPVEAWAMHELGRPVHIGSLHIHVLSLTPSATAKDLKVANAAWAGRQPLADVQRLKVAVSLPQLLRGRVVIADLEINQGAVDLHRARDGRVNWSQGKENGELGIPVIQRLRVDDARIRFVDEARGLAFDGTLNSTDSAAGGNRAFHLVGKGTLNREPIKVEVTGGTVLGTTRDRPYPFTAVASHGATRVSATGTFAHAFDLSAWTAKTTVSGANMADLYYLTGVAFPLTKPYHLSGELTRAGPVFRFKGFVGKVGGSDLAGVMKVDTSGARLMFSADLHSKLLDPADAGVIFGSNKSDGRRLLPDVKLDVHRLRQMDADVAYKAEAINVSTLPLKKVALHLTLDNGRLTVKPMTLTLPQGRVSGTLVVNARQAVPEVVLDATLSGARLQDLVPDDALEGPLLARVKLQGKGDSVHAAAAAADGRVVVVIPGGEIRQAFAELMGINVATGLGLLLSDSQQQVALRCGIAHFEAHDGVLVARHLVFDTSVVKATGSGTVNLDNEALDLELRGHPTELRVLRLMAPVTITGTLLDPKLGVDLSKAGTQAGIATVLGVALSPLAAILPFVDPGLADKADCRRLLGYAERGGVPLEAK